MFSPQPIFSCTRDFSIGSLGRTSPSPCLCFSWILSLVVASLSTLCPNHLGSHPGLFPLLLLISHQAGHSLPLTSLIHFIVFTITALTQAFSSRGQIIMVSTKHRHWACWLTGVWFFRLLGSKKPKSCYYLHAFWWFFFSHVVLLLPLIYLCYYLHPVYLNKMNSLRLKD